MRSYDWKLKARRALTGRWHTALMVTLIAALPSMLMQVLTILNQQRYLAQNGSVTIEQMLSDPQLVLIPQLLNAAVLVLSSCLALGKMDYMLRSLRGETADVGTVFSRMWYFFKAMGLEVLLVLKTTLWILPVAVAEGLLLALLGPESTLSAILLTLMLFGGMGLTIWLLLRYTLAFWVLADEPDTRISLCIWQSVRLMKNRKGLLLGLYLSFFGWGILVVAAQEIMTLMLGNVIGSTVGMALNLALQVYAQMAVGAFYLSVSEKTDDLPHAEMRQE